MANGGPKTYFKQMEQNFGPDWVVGVKPEDIQRSVKRIVRDMVKGSINYETEGKYFLNYKILDNFMIALNNELQINVLYQQALEFYAQYYQHPFVGVQIDHLAKLNNIYNTILQKLNLVKMYSNIGYLADISGLLYADRNHLNG